MLDQRADESLFEYWISFWPTAPFFGVRWRFEHMAPGFDAFYPAAASPEPAAPTVVPVAPVTPAPVVDAAPAAPAKPAGLLDVAPADADDLTRIKGVGPKLEQMLNKLGVYKFAQIAAMGEDDLAWLDGQLAIFRGRPYRDDWIGQAKGLI